MKKTLLTTLVLCAALFIGWHQLWSRGSDLSPDLEPALPLALGERRDDPNPDPASEDQQPARVQAPGTSSGQPRVEVLEIDGDRVRVLR